MKKSLLLFSTIVMFSFLACGGKAKQTEENKKSDR